MSKKVEKIFVVGMGDYNGGNEQFYRSVNELDQAFQDGDFDEDEDIVELQVVKRYRAGKKLELIDG